MNGKPDIGRSPLLANPTPVHFGRFGLRARPLRSPVVNPTWYVVLTNPKCEERARAGLEALGYATFLPVETVWVKHPQRRKARFSIDGKQPGKSKVSRPLFPGYLFVGLDKGVHPFDPVRLTDGVYDIIMNAGEYVSIPSAAIDRLRAEQEAGSHDKTVKAAQKLLDLVGRLVMIHDGPMAGFMATVKRATESGAEVEVEAFGKRVKLRTTLEGVA